MDPVVVKVGGSLALQPESLMKLCTRLSEIAHRHRLIVVPGGGEFADAVRSLDKRFGLSSVTAHRMAILGMDQYGLMLADLMPGSQLIVNLEGLRETSDRGIIPIFLPSAFLLHESALENSWDATSDSIAVFIAGKLHLAKTILVTDVDGIFTCDPKKSPEATLITKLSATELLKMNERTAVDKFLPKLLLQLPMECFVVNGLHPERIAAILNEKETPCTLINR